ncbi:long chain acyl-CoA synthetase 6, peroxisomal-like protein [Tanacetum coccineum]|uniref:Long chain acyl-CoA synthetase 6, peroxisomal-like protein n=1 Tax=Tanacetum coccineum TaxID=301880 RepID=A0ABQ5B0N6_9ASTR
MASLRPTLFFSVPRVYNKLYVDITNVVKSSGGLKQSLFNTAYNAKKHTILNGKNSYAIWDIFFFNKIKGMLGGQVYLMLSAASPLSADVLDFLRVCFSCIFLEAYGMTKIYCAISNIDLDDNLCRHIGSPRGVVFQCYYKDEFHFEDVNEGKHSRITFSKERGNDGDMIQELAEEYIDMIQERIKTSLFILLESYQTTQEWLLSSRVSDAVVGLVLPLCSLTQLSFMCQAKDSGPD